MADSAGTASANHGHVALITAALLVTGGALEKESSGASHTHVVTFDAPA